MPWRPLKDYPRWIEVSLAGFPKGIVHESKRGVIILWSEGIAVRKGIGSLPFPKQGRSGEGVGCAIKIKAVKLGRLGGHTFCPSNQPENKNPVIFRYAHDDKIRPYDDFSDSFIVLHRISLLPNPNPSFLMPQNLPSHRKNEKSCSVHRNRNIGLKRD